MLLPFYKLSVSTLSVSACIVKEKFDSNKSQKGAGYPMKIRNRGPALWKNPVLITDESRMRFVGRNQTLFDFSMSSAKNSVFCLQNHSARFFTASRFRIFIECFRPFSGKSPISGPLPPASGRAMSCFNPPSPSSRRHLISETRPAILRHPRKHHPVDPAPLPFAWFSPRCRIAASLAYFSLPLAFSHDAAKRQANPIPGSKGPSPWSCFGKAGVPGEGNLWLETKGFPPPDLTYGILRPNTLPIRHFRREDIVLRAFFGRSRPC